jgi:hypothetical protein
MPQAQENRHARIRDRVPVPAVQGSTALRPALRGLDPARHAAQWSKGAARGGCSGICDHEYRGWRTASMFRRYAIVSRTDQRDAMEKLEAARLQQRSLNSALLESTAGEKGETARELKPQ